jgi:hypothetical protein
MELMEFGGAFDTSLIAAANCDLNVNISSSLRRLKRGPNTI